MFGMSSNCGMTKQSNMSWYIDTEILFSANDLFSRSLNNILLLGYTNSETKQILQK